ncbi:hypothetical protein BN946_scf185044.g5 [Trametes cinnabarina]|uniref:Ribosome production factor 2 homolog n=1 Tax=Pycnoporus cinnabarinus TaxID=5643 RepID=A0A060S159_PYCCI|nr:hypothetical protein BN946_scf185044.g5 [Trametes cinnabarina]
MLRTVKPKNARSKRALQAREPKEVEDPRTAIFVKGTHTGQKVNGAMKELMALKRPHAISFAKKNLVRPFEDTSSLEFWAQKNDASLFLLGQSTKKRPDGLTFVRMFDYRVLDIIEVGVDMFKSMNDFKLKSMLIDFFNGEVIDQICLAGIEHVISISLGPPASLNATTTTLQAQPSSSASASAPSDSSDPASLPKVHIRGYTIRLLASGTRIPRVELTPMGPFIDLSLRRHQEPDAELLKQALKRPKVRKQEVEKGLGKKRKNLEVDDMGDLRGRIHVGKQDLSRLQTRKMKGLKKGSGGDGSDLDVDVSDDDGGEADDGGRRRKRQRAA